jgi:hypothetical protein
MRFQSNSLPTLKAFSQAPVWFIIRREPFYHKLQYSKTPKNDPMAAFLGAALGAFVVYMGLSTFGTSGADLSDLTIVVWYLLLLLTTLRGLLLVLVSSLSGGLSFFRLFFHVFLFLFFLPLLPLLHKLPALQCFTSSPNDFNPKKTETIGFLHPPYLWRLALPGFILGCRL